MVTLVTLATYNFYGASVQFSFENMLKNLSCTAELPVPAYITSICLKGCANDIV
jgi:hypothetical protein